MSSKYEAAFQAAVIDRERQICIDLLRETPELTLGEIHKLSKGSLGRIFDAISVAEILAGAASSAPAKPKGRVGRPRGSKSSPKAKAKAKAPAQQSLVEQAEPAAAVEDAVSEAPPTVNTRTPAGRAAYDKAIFQALTDIGEPVGVAKLMARAGGTNLQARAALNRLIDAGKVSWTGKARGTRYNVT